MQDVQLKRIDRAIEMFIMLAIGTMTVALAAFVVMLVWAGIAMVNSGGVCR